MTDTKHKTTKEEPKLYETMMPSERANARFVAGLDVSSDATNFTNAIEVFLRCTKELQATKRSFGFEDLWQIAKRYDLDANVCKALFEKWVATQIDFKRIEQLKTSCYDSETYLNIGV